MQGQGNPTAINIIFIIIKGINIKNSIICVININISTIVQIMNIKNIIIYGINIIICGTNIFIFIIIESVNIYFYCSSKFNIKNIIICGTKIIIFIIIESITTKNSIIYGINIIICGINIFLIFIIESINIKNSIIYVLNIMIFIII